MATSIQTEELIWRKSNVMEGGKELGGVADPSANPANGGIMTKDEAGDAVKNAIFPDAPQSELTSGSLLWRKIFIHVSSAWDGTVQTNIEANGSDLNLVQPRVFIESWTPGQDSVAFFTGSQTDTQATASASRLYGTGYLDQPASIDDTTLDVFVETDEDGTVLDLFADGDLVRITNKGAVDGAGEEEYVTLSSEPGAPAGNVVTLNFTTTPLVYNWSAGTNVKIASVYGPATVVANVSNIVPATTSGTFNDEIYCPNLSSIEEEWIITINPDGITYEVDGTTSGKNFPGGTIANDFSPTNTDFTAPYFTIKGGANWGGTWANGETITFQTHPASIPVWYRRMIPALTDSLASNSAIVGITGQST